MIDNFIHYSKNMGLLLIAIASGALIAALFILVFIITYGLISLFFWPMVLFCAGIICYGVAHSVYQTIKKENAIAKMQFLQD